MPEESKRGDDHALVMPDGEAVEIAKSDNVLPRINETEASVGITIQQDRIKMSEEDECEVSVATAHRNISDATPFATIYAGIGLGHDEDDLYAEIAFDDPEQLRELRDALTTVLRYRGEAE